MGYRSEVVGKSIRTANNKIGIIVEAHDVPDNDPNDPGGFSHIIKAMFPGERKGKVYVVNNDRSYNNYEILGE